MPMLCSMVLPDWTKHVPLDPLGFQPVKSLQVCSAARVDWPFSAAPH